jgi:hypothetical protein
MATDQCECGRPVPHIPQDRGLPEQAGASEESLAPLEANTDSFFFNRFDPHWGHGVPVHLLERTRISLSAPHFPQ